MQFLFHSGEYPQQPWALQCFLVFKYDTERKIARGGFNFSPFEHYHARSFSAYINDYLSPEWISVSVAVFFFFLALEGELMLSVLKLLVMDILKLMGSFAQRCQALICGMCMPIQWFCLVLPCLLFICTAEWFRPGTGACEYTEQGGRVLPALPFLLPRSWLLEGASGFIVLSEGSGHRIYLRKLISLSCSLTFIRSISH